MSKPRFFTGIQATGTLTLGNYCGLIHHILKIQEQYEIIIMIGDLHALTIPNKEIDYQKKSQEIAALLYACGLKEENCKIFIQSQIKEHLELSFLLSPYITVGILSNMIQYKEKKKEQETGNLALLSYPVLMAADIFLYDPDLVIVGQDQAQHLELASDLANKFNNFYGKNLLKMPQVPNFNAFRLGAKIRGLKNPTKKMSKSENDYLALLDKPEIIIKKIKEAETDSENKIYYDPTKKPGISNLLTIYTLLKKENKLPSAELNAEAKNNSEIKEAEAEMAGLNYHQFKLKLIDLLNERLGKIQANYNIYLPKIKGMLEKNNNYLQELAQKKLKIIKKELKLNDN
ncbi:MAG: tryptophan--tRNA ligase [Candidatus Moeniiplasma glomeromycotorum]|nr:tryptophan--tRNA ligase [Candidatus Moeniiplasma glomeromycotorum]